MTARSLLRLCAGSLLLAGSSAGLSAQTLLAPDTTHRFTLPSGHVTNELAVDVPANARQLHITAEGPENGDIDLLLRYGGAFPDGTANLGGPEWLYEHAHYVSMSPGSSERLTVTRSQKQPLRAGRWYLSVINYSGGAAQIDVRASLSTQEPGPVNIEAVFDDEEGCADRGATTTPWFDSTSATPIQGNNGTTLGAQRRNAFLHAVSKLREDLTGVADLRIRACWANLGGESNRATLASASPTYVVRDDGVWWYDNNAPTNTVWSMPFLDSRYSWYTVAGAAQRAGTEFCRYASNHCGEADIFIQFNTDIDGATALGNRRFHYGFNAPEGNNLDFVSTAMHEIGHGLGFVSLYSNSDDNETPAGTRFRGYDDVFSDSVVAMRDNVPVPINTLGPAEIREALTSNLGLRWADAAAAASPLNPWRDRAFPANLPALYAPPEMSAGSTMSHISDLMPQSLMQPFNTGALRTLGLAAPMLSAVGWRTQANTDIPAVPLPYGGQWFDPARSGHGLDLHRLAGSEDIYVMVLYTFDAQGQPEWYTASGRIIDGIFLPGNAVNGHSLQRVRYTNIDTIPMERALDDSVPGQVRIDFGADAAKAAACRDGTSRNGPVALMTFSLGEERNMKWCLTQITPRGNRPATDFTGHRYGEGDVGWGLTTMGFNTAQGDGLFSILYFPDGAGNPRWAAAQVDDFETGVPQPVYQIQGYCRTCPKPDSNPATQIGTITLRLADPASANGGADIDVQFNGGAGGRFTRSGSVLRLLADAGDDD